MDSCRGYPVAGRFDPVVGATQGEQIQAMKTAITLREHVGDMSGYIYEVPCGDCSLCCLGDAVRILPHEPQDKWDTEPNPYFDDARVLAHDCDGACVYLSGDGCLIQDDKPQQCREMDCRRVAKAITYTQARKLDRKGLIPLTVWKRGRDLLRAEK